MSEVVAAPRLQKNRRRRFHWLLLISAILAMPVVAVYLSVLSAQADIWRHLADTVLSDYIFNSLILAFCVGVGTLVIGTALAWCVAKYQFSGRNLVQWLVVLPLAMPAYIIAYTYTGLLDFAGPLQSALREQFSWGYQDYWFPEIRSLSGAILVMSLVLYPYVYILARTAFAEQPRSLKEAASSLGASTFGYFLRVSFPMARPAILTGAALAMMEAFADYGTVAYFGVSTFTTGIFRTWFGLGNQLAASQLAAMLCTFVLVVLLLERWSRKHIRYFQTGQMKPAGNRVQLSGAKSWAMLGGCMLAPLLGFFIPVGQLLSWSFRYSEFILDQAFWQLVINSFSLAAVAGGVIVILALLFGYAKRISKDRLMAMQVQTVSLGYAIPGTVIAVGVLLPLSWADHSINYLLDAWFNYTPGLVLSGTVFALLLAYTVRFMSVAIQNIEAGLGRITPSMDEAASSLGQNAKQVLFQVHLPIMRTSMLSAFLLVFVDVLKELPATLILRPFNFNTLAVSAYQYASDERLIDAAAPALAIVAAGLIPVILISKALDRQ